MVISIDAVRYGANVVPSSDWHEVVAESMAEQARQTDAAVFAPARGAAYGLLLSGALWVGLVAAARAVLAFLR